jgi:hypothetical protein
VGDAGVGQVVRAGEGRHEGVRVGPLHRDVEQLPGEDVAGAVETTCGRNYEISLAIC